MEKIICWGTGKQAEKILEILSFELYDILFFVDVDEKKWGSNIKNFKINSPDLVIDNLENCSFLLITTQYWEQVFEKCVKLGICAKQVKYFDIRDNKIKNINEMYTEMYANIVFSQEGEEIYLREKFRNKTKGVYIDVGAFHPFRFSNTYWAYMQGWKGINIEPDFDNYKLLCALRPMDTNINCGISSKKGELKYYSFREKALNTFLKENITNVQDIMTVKVELLKNILSQENIRDIDFIDIDVEGMEMDVLESINWNEVSINCILVEQLDGQTYMRLPDVMKSKVYKYLNERGYEAINKYGRTVIYEKY